MGETERLIYQCDIDKLARESFITHVWSRDPISIHHLKIWFLDAQVNKNELVLLVAAANPNLGKLFRFLTFSYMVPPETCMGYSSKIV